MYDCYIFDQIILPNAIDPHRFALTESPCVVFTDASRDFQRRNLSELTLSISFRISEANIYLRE